ncbi:hypothetical protein CN97_00115 [Haematobacter massiliensis]|uniref:Uncharacterized protein n=1 Tax=Haematobacter massiliensis TaxID=195105 RepID=A0A086Y0F8_9RHOB|nr:hypothetical protein [Haematobacter massiliensis]KFI27758.1 hypothetical protein CN97_00115 [Haematobacter massiliensis]OWJ82046.1 hypothetical protein CDV51_18475 [Haematobacter massiliensis]QBJ24022.1 hypothetical protein HmaOT1_06980 [Haematobacter massiliensis]
MITGKDIAHIDRPERAVSFAYTVSSLVTAARLALEVDTGNDDAEMQKWAAVRTLELAEVFMGAVIDGMEMSGMK